VGCIAVKKKALAEEREIPMQEKEDNNNHLDGFLMVNKDRRRGRLKRKIPPMVSIPLP
jgi:hypothetical protein